MDPRHRSRGSALPAKRFWRPPEVPALAGELSIPTRPRACRDFVVGDYCPAGQLVRVPLECLYADDDVACLVVEHHRRRRKTGPLHPLVVCRCEVHDVGFTVYPPGFVPYARRPILAGPAQHDVPALFEVARESAEGPWERVAHGGTDRWWATQRRLLERAAEVFGLLEVSLRVVVSVVAGISLTALEEAAVARGVRARGAALTRLRRGLDTDALIALGGLTGCWGTAWKAAFGGGRLQPLAIGRDPPRLWSAAGDPPSSDESRSCRGSS